MTKYFLFRPKVKLPYKCSLRQEVDRSIEDLKNIKFVLRTDAGATGFSILLKVR